MTKNETMKSNHFESHICKYLLIGAFLSLVTGGCGARMADPSISHLDGNSSSGTGGSQPTPGGGSTGDSPPAITDTTPLPANAILVKNAAEFAPAIQSATAGVTIALASGNYGSLSIQGKTYSSKVFIRPQPGAKPVLKSLMIRDCSNIQVSSLTLAPRLMNGDQLPTGEAVQIVGDDIVFENSYINSIDDSSQWTPQDWITYAVDGISESGNRNIVRNNLIKNVAFAIGSGSQRALISGNVIDGFRGDGMRGFGAYAVFENNEVRNCFQVDDNHMDGFQSWTFGAPVTGITLRGNRFFESKNKSNPNIPCQMQAIGLFDGFYANWVIENNLIVVDHWHGITLMGATNCKVVNNTVVDRVKAGGNDPVPWIDIANHKDGRASTGNIVANNIAATINGVSGTELRNNHVLRDPLAVFVNAAEGDFHLKTGSPAIDMGYGPYAPATDILGVSRSRGAGVDIGAFEF